MFSWLQATATNASPRTFHTWVRASTQDDDSWRLLILANIWSFANSVNWTLWPPLKTFFHTNQKDKDRAHNALLTFSFDSCLYSGSIFFWIEISCRNHGGVGGLARLKYVIKKNAIWTVRVWTSPWCGTEIGFLCSYPKIKCQLTQEFRYQRHLRSPARDNVCMLITDIACHLVKGLQSDFLKTAGREVRTEVFENPMLPESLSELYTIKLKKAKGHVSPGLDNFNILIFHQAPILLKSCTKRVVLTQK